MIEDDLRAAFTRHEELAPPTGPLRATIDRLVARRRRRRHVGAAATAFVLIAAVALGVPQLAAYPDRSPVAPGLLGERSKPAARTGALNVLLLGVDGTSAAWPPAADAVLLVHVPADRSRIYLISLPRDLAVAIPGHGVDNLNAAFRYGAGAREPNLAGGYALTRRSVAELTGVPVDAGAVVTYPALRAVTDAVDGVRVCLPEPVRSAHTRRVFPAGCQHLDGTGAVDLLRQRYGLTWGAQDRDRNTQRYAAALLHRLAGQQVLTNPARLYALLTAAGPGLTLDTGRADLLALLAQVSTLTSAEPVGLLLPTVETDARPGTYQVDRTDAPALFAALREDRLAGWVAANPEHVVAQG